MKPKLKIIGKDGNAFSILGEARRAAKKAGWSKEEVEKMLQESMSGDYDNLLNTMSKYFDVR
jgi:hypothetical protein